jgi:hypothetical protein
MKRRALKIASNTFILFIAGILCPIAHAQQVTYKPYIQPGDASKLGPSDQMVIAWQTDETTPNASAYVIHFGTTPALGRTVSPSGRLVDNYLAADPALAALSIPTAYGAHTDYYAKLGGLKFDTTYFYTVTGPGLGPSGFSAFFHTRKRGNSFTFQVQGDEGYYPGIPKASPTDPSLVANFEARIIHTMFNVDKLSFPGQPKLPSPDFALNMGDNVYVTGAEDNYRDFWMKDWNSDSDSNERGAPFVRHIPLYIVDGNHDVGSTGATVNLLADDPPTVPGSSGPGPFGGGTGGGDALGFFNNYYFPLNGPVGVDIQNRFVGDNSTPGNFFFQFNGHTYTSPLAIEGLRASTTVNTGHGTKRQIDHMSNYSFDYGNAHFVFLDANPHLFDNLLPGGNTFDAPPSFPFPAYPSVLRNWLINDLDGSNQTWKIVVYHQPSFSSGNATLRNDQMRTIAKFLEDHGVNMVFNGHEHNYQRTLPLRTLPAAVLTPNSPGPAAVATDTNFDGVSKTVPDGVLYFVEGAGGNRDFDDALPNPRGSSPNTIDQEDSATGTFTPSGSSHSFPNGPASWLDTNLTNSAMTPFLPAAGSGPKITAKFKAKVFSFADVVVNDNKLTLYQITEPLTNSSSATASNPLPFGTDIDGKRLNDPIPDTVFDPATRRVISPPAVGTPALLDKLTLTKPDLDDKLVARLSAPKKVKRGDKLTYKLEIKSKAGFALNGAQVVLDLPEGVNFVSATGGEVTKLGSEIVVTIGRLAPGADIDVSIVGQVSSKAEDDEFVARAVLRSGTALPETTNEVETRVVRDRDSDEEGGDQ